MTLLDRRSLIDYDGYYAKYVDKIKIYKDREGTLLVAVRYSKAFWHSSVRTDIMSFDVFNEYAKKYGVVAKNIR